jgi:1,2-diacylglycerol 3-beta-glucosyltransferase
VTRVVRAVELLARGLGWGTATAVTYLLTIAAAAAAGRRSALAGEATGSPLRFVVLIPAHDEEGTLPRTLDAVRRLDYPADLVRVVVIADNCSDATADAASSRGVEVLERRSAQRGKGPALAWALGRLREGASNHHAVVFLDADCLPSRNLLVAIDRRLRAGASAVQAAYTVANPTDSQAAALRYASFALINTVRPLGKDVLGLSAGISGSGFAIERSTLEREGWTAYSLTEDTEYHLQLLEAGVTVRFAPEASVTSPMPASLTASRTQQSRWDAGKVEMIRRWAPRLVAAGVRRRDPRLLHAAIEGFMPPQSALAASSLLVVAAGASLRSRAVLRLGLGSAAGQLVYVLGGLRLANAPPSVYRALAFAPVLMAWKLWQYGDVIVRGRPRGWERTGR